MNLGPNALGLNNHHERTMDFMRRDFEILLRGLEGKSLGAISLDAVKDYLELLKTMVERVSEGIEARDNFISYTFNEEDIPTVFAAEEPTEPSMHDERTMNFLKKDFAILLRGIEGKRLEEINLDAIIELLGMLQDEVEDVKQGIRARDRFISYTMTPEEMPDVFTKTDTKKQGL